MLGALVACGGEGRGPIERGAPPPPSRADVAPPDAASVRIDAAIAPPEVASVEVDAAVDGGHAAATTPPAGLADVAVAIPDAVLDLRYATAANLTGAPLYPVARCWLRVEAVDRLAEAAAALRADGYRLVLWDCYRPASVQRLLWERVPDPRFVARPVFDDQGRPLSGSVHSRGGAVDVSLADRDGQPVPMPTDHDDFSAAASGAAATGPARVNLRALRAAMRGAGYRGIGSEWWHFEAAGGTRPPLLDEPLR